MRAGKFLLCAAAVLAAAGCNKKAAESGSGNALTPDTVKITEATPPAGGNWTNVVNATAAGFMMGNPNAKVKLVEIGSLSCPHCKKFEEEGAPALIQNYVKTGSVSWEFRPYVIHGPIDMAANIIARCSGTKAFFPLTQAMYKDQDAIMSKLEKIPQDKVNQIQNLPTNQVFIQMASLMGLQDWAAERGVAQAKSNQCLSDQKMIDNEVQLTTEVGNQYPEFKGTPSFIINGKMLPEDANTWSALEPALKDALK